MKHLSQIRKRQADEHSRCNLYLSNIEHCGLHILEVLDVLDERPRAIKYGLSLFIVLNGAEVEDWVATRVLLDEFEQRHFHVKQSLVRSSFNCETAGQVFVTSLI